MIETVSFSPTATPRASRMREEMTISLIGPLPRSHSPARLVRSLSFIVFEFLIFDCRFLIGRAGADPSIENQKPQIKNSTSSFRLPDLVTQLGRPFVVLGLDGAGQFFSELGHVDLSLHRHAAAAPARGHLADMVRRPLV